MTKHQAKILWIQLHIKKVVFIFDCGGDSMNSTEIKIYDINEDLVEDDYLETYFDSEVYNNVDFYENSDGVYIGEHGEVTITLEEEEFEYTKDSVEQWEETTTITEVIPLPIETIEYLNNVTDFELSANESFFEYKEGFKEISEIEETLTSLLEEKSDDLLPEDSENFEYSEWYNIKLVSVNKDSITVNFNYSFYVERQE